MAKWFWRWGLGTEISAKNRRSWEEQRCNQMAQTTHNKREYHQGRPAQIIRPRRPTAGRTAAPCSRNQKRRAYTIPPHPPQSTILIRPTLPHLSEQYRSRRLKHKHIKWRQPLNNQAIWNKSNLGTERMKKRENPQTSGEEGAQWRQLPAGSNPQQRIPWQQRPPEIHIPEFASSDKSPTPPWARKQKEKNKKAEPTVSYPSSCFQRGHSCYVNRRSNRKAKTRHAAKTASATRLTHCRQDPRATRINQQPEHVISFTTHGWRRLCLP